MFELFFIIISCFTFIALRVVLREKMESPRILKIVVTATIILAVYYIFGMNFIIYISRNNIAIAYISSVLSSFFIFLLPVVYSMIFLNKGWKIWLCMIPSLVASLHFLIPYIIISKSFNLFFDPKLSLAWFLLAVYLIWGAAFALFGRKIVRFIEKKAAK